jgi:hypothetical protein
MNISPEQLEWIVQEVIRRLRSLDAEKPAAGGELRLTERVVTMSTLRGRLASARRVIVLSRAIVTPAVRDELKDRQIELVREAPK